MSINFVREIRTSIIDALSSWNNSGDMLFRATSLEVTSSHLTNTVHQENNPIYCALKREEQQLLIDMSDAHAEVSYDLSFMF